MSDVTPSVREAMVERVALALAKKQCARDQERAGCDVALLIDPYMPTAHEDARLAVQIIEDAIAEALA